MIKGILRPLKNLATATTARIGSELGVVRWAETPVSFVAEKADWSIRWDGEHIRDVINELTHTRTVEVTDVPYHQNSKVVHFGSQYMWLEWSRFLSKKNRFVVSFFHGKPEDGPDVARHIERFLRSLPSLTTVVTAASLVEQRLLEWGVPREKLVRIPIGVDTFAFCPPTSVQRERARARFGFAPDRIVIGSFQKDGVGWGDGMEPKLIKGPDLLVEAITRLARELPVSVLLTGPARGYVKRELAVREIPFVHTFFKNQNDLAECYHALDLYLVTSREEGGPKGLMEGMASGVPVVSTAVGMAPDLIQDGLTGGLTPPGSADEIAEKALRLLHSDELDGLRARARDAVGVADWTAVGRDHWLKVYKPALAR